MGQAPLAAVGPPSRRPGPALPELHRCRAPSRDGEMKNGWRNWRVAKSCRGEAEQSGVKRCSSRQPGKPGFSPTNTAWGSPSLLV